NMQNPGGVTIQPGSHDITSGNDFVFYPDGHFVFQAGVATLGSFTYTYDLSDSYGGVSHHVLTFQVNNSLPSAPVGNFDIYYTNKDLDWSEVGTAIMWDKTIDSAYYPPGTVDSGRNLIRVTDNEGDRITLYLKQGPSNAKVWEWD